ncbi:hypothetical protein [Solirubrum puertoriconensis]|uniref:Uncharacterized protein n=1 Tax=Solirubrum puertoriconensis TaxID=1751427 RepID=A0A9X0HI59_SOLP1|nr:hypothetical protein [Solirubrum puertoriconensis]KUG06309.1 hypothetical protein ASU33_02835 [Solirubrum puertoriconensis]
MLDFYLLDDAAPRPSPARLAELPKAGQLSAEDFTDLQEQRIIEKRLDYWQDFRWSNGIVNMKLQMLLHRHPQLSPASLQADTPAQRLFLLLLNASAAHTGLLAIGHDDHA